MFTIPYPPLGVINFIALTIFVWVVLLATSTTEKNKLIAPAVRHHRFISYFLESLVVSVILNLVPITFLALAVPVVAVGYLLMWQYRRTIKRIILASTPDSWEFWHNGDNVVSVKSKRLSVRQIQNRMTSVYAANDIVITTFMIVGMIVIFSKIIPH